MINQDEVDWLINRLQTQPEHRSVIFVPSYKDREQLVDELSVAGIDATLNLQGWLRGEYDHVLIGEGHAIGWHAPAEGVHLIIMGELRTPELRQQLLARLTR